jgi:aspartate racemase
VFEEPSGMSRGEIMNKTEPAWGNALNRRELLRLLGVGGAVAAAPALGKIVREGESQRADVFIVGPTLMAEGGGQSAQLPPASDLKMVGLIGGTAWYSTVDYYRYINEAVNDAYGNNTNPPLLLYNMNNAKIQELQARGQWDEVASLFSQAAARLRAGGAQAILFCSNTSHKVYPQVARTLDLPNLPILHIGDATGVAIRTSDLKKVGLIGTKYTMEDGFMVDWLKEHYGIETLVPSSGSARQELQRIIHEELDEGIYKPESKKYVIEQMEELRKRTAQGIVLACTEFPLIIKQRDFALPVFDTTRLHSQMAVDFILGKQGLAHVRPDK